MEPQPGATMPGNTSNYDFILSPDKQKRGGGLGLGKDPFITKIIFLVGGAVVLMIAVGVIISLVFSGKNNIETFVALAQREQEVVRISALGDDAVSQQIKNAAINTQVSVNSHQSKSLAYLKKHKRTVEPAELALKKDKTVDAKLKQAKETSTFDKTYVEIMRTLLAAYANELKNAYNNESRETQRQTLALQYKDVQLLLRQWPEE